MRIKARERGEPISIWRWPVLRTLLKHLWCRFLHQKYDWEWNQDRTKATCFACGLECTEEGESNIMGDTKKPQTEGKIIAGVTLVEVGPNGEQLYQWGDDPINNSLWLCGWNCASNVKVGDTGRLVYRSTASHGLYWFEKDRSLAERIRDAAVETDERDGFITPGLAGFFVPKVSEPLYCIVDPPSLRNAHTIFCFWSLGPTEEDAWRFFENGCADAGNGAIERARRDGLQCVRVRLSVEAVIKPDDNCSHERPRVECNDCDYLEDLAFDANRERRTR